MLGAIAMAQFEHVWRNMTLSMILVQALLTYIQAQMFNCPCNEDDERYNARFHLFDWQMFKVTSAMQKNLNDEEVDLWKKK